MNKLISITSFLFGCFCLFSASAEAGNDQKADFSGQLFFEQCIAGRGDAASITVRNDFSLVPLPDSKAKLFLNNQPGKAWTALVPFGNFVLTIHSHGLCSVHIRRVDSLAIKEAFLWVLNYTAGKSGKVEQISEEQLEQEYGLLHQYTYKVTGRDGFGSYNAVLSVTDSSMAPLQALMSIAPIP
ncbi:NMCC_0638 family (lipo)protein [Thiobacillus sp.]